MSAPTTHDDDATRWFDEEFASTIKPALEPRPISFDSYLERQEHQDLVAAFRRSRSLTGTGQHRVTVAQPPDADE